MLFVIQLLKLFHLSIIAKQTTPKRSGLKQQRFSYVYTFVSQKSRQGNSSALCGIDWGHLMIFSYWLGWAGRSKMSSPTCLAFCQVQPESWHPIPLHVVSGLLHMVSLAKLSVISQGRSAIPEQDLQEIGREILEPEPAVWHSITSASF